MEKKLAENGHAEQRLVIMGGGLAGLSLAIQIKQRQPQLDVQVIERMRHPVSEASHKVGESLVELSSHYFAKVLGLKEHLVEKQLPKLGLRFVFRPDVNQPADLRVDECIEFGAKRFPRAASYQLDRGIFENFLAQYCAELGVTFIDGAKVTDVELNKAEQLHSISYQLLAKPEQSVQVACRWVVDACSRSSPIKRQKNLAKASGHEVSAAWFRIATKLDINQLSPNSAWAAQHSEEKLSRWYSTCHFMGDGYWLWFIPLASGSTSIGIVAENKQHPLESYNNFEKAMAWLQQHEPKAAAFIGEQAEKLQDFRVLRNFSHDCEQVFSKDRWFLTGEAGAFLDPFYSPGSDFIAISNTFICQLIDVDINDRPSFASNCLMLDMFYLNLFRNTALVYQDMYPVFSHPVVMPVKILWDFSVYWSFTAFLYMQGQFESTEALFKLRRYFEDIGTMNSHLQKLLRLWATRQAAMADPMYIDPFDIDFLKQLNEGLDHTFADDEQFKAQFIANIQRLKRLYQYICQAIYDSVPDLQEQAAAGEIFFEDLPDFAEVEQIEQLLQALLARSAELKMA